MVEEIYRWEFEKDALLLYSHGCSFSSGFDSIGGEISSLPKVVESAVASWKCARLLRKEHLSK